MTQNQLTELLETDQIRAMVEGGEERGLIDPAQIKAFAPSSSSTTTRSRS